MAKADKELEKAKNNPRGWHFEKLAALYRKFGFTVESAKGSHFTAWHPKIKSQATLVNHPGEIPPAYVKQAVAMIEELLALEGDSDEHK